MFKGIENQKIKNVQEERKMFKGMGLKELRMYYFDNVSVDEFPTFIHWVLYLREKGEF